MLELSGCVGKNATRPQSALNMMQFMYLWLPLIFDVLIMFALSRMNVAYLIFHIGVQYLPDIVRLPSAVRDKETVQVGIVYDVPCPVDGSLQWCTILFYSNVVYGFGNNVCFVLDDR